MHRDSEDIRLRAILLTLLLAGMAVAIGGPLQVYFSKIFRCGRVDAAPELYVLFGLAAIQIALFLAAQYNARFSPAYRITQWIAIALCAYQGLLLADAYRTTFLLLGLVMAGSAGVALIIVRPAATPASRLGVSQLFSALPYLAALSVLLAVHWLVGSGLIAQFFLYRPDGPLTTAPLIFSLVAGATIALTGCWSFHRRNYERLRHLDSSAFPPLFVLLLVLLRAKYPDGSYDAFLYKGVWPYQIAEWRTAGMAIVDQFGLGSNFQEMFNGFLLILAADYTPSLISTFSITALFFVLPCCINLTIMPHGLSRLMFGFATAVIVSLSEVAVAHGTVYQEPFLVLLLTLGLLNAWTWPIVLSAAIATKLSAVFALPLVLIYKFVPADQPFLAYLLRRRFAIIAAIGLIGLFLWPQIDRNLIYSGRIFGRTETLAAWTDPPGSSAVLSAGDTLFRMLPRGGFLNNLALSSCNAFSLDLFCDTTYQNEHTTGFHVFPSSRAFLLGVFLACATILASLIARNRSALAILASLAFLGGYLMFLSMATIGRFFVVPSWMLAVLVLCVSKIWLDKWFSLPRIIDTWSTKLKAICAIAVVGLLAVVTTGDLIAGTFTNHGWQCKRDVRKPALAYGLNSLRVNSRYGRGLAVQRYLEDLAARYRKSCPPPGLSPTILLAGYGDSWILPYPGMHVASPAMLDRLLSVDAERESRLPRAVAAIVVEDTAQLDAHAHSQSSQFTQCFKNSDTQIFCSRQLAPLGDKCVRSIYEGVGSFNSPGLAWTSLYAIWDRIRGLSFVTK